MSLSIFWYNVIIRVNGNQNEVHMTEKCKERIIQLTKWNNYYDNPTMGTMKYLALRRKETGFDECTTMINGRLYIFIEKFFCWLESKGKNKKNEKH
jgi:hypothetical protein